MAETQNEQNLLSSLTDMHALSSGAFQRIRGIARCALRSLETESGARDLESIADALTAIAMEAAACHNDVSVEAERHSIQTIDVAWRRRLEAMPTERAVPAKTGEAQ